MKRFLLTVCSLFFIAQGTLSAQTPSSLPQDVDFWSNYPDEILAKTLVSRMSDEELLAQILMFGWAGAEPSDLLNSW
ncbi:MAG: glycoside hydrolase family 3 protein, partial [Treponema sp.]|nr:glycoside hydrolase family 3 protein [Treponema sp.]